MGWYSPNLLPYLINIWYSLRGPGKLTDTLSAFRNVLSTQCDISMVPAGWEVAESRRKAESMLTLAESVAVILP
jgi:hypothetical protein